MIDPNSRYAGLAREVLQTVRADGQEHPIRSLRRRFIPAEAEATLFEHTVTQGERLDVITARYLGDPTQFWRVCDANNVLRPRELTEEPGRSIKITLPRG